MATINGIYIFVESENLSRDVDISTHNVEKGLDITDNVKKKPRSLSISGKIVGEDSATSQLKIAEYMYTGTLINYSGRNFINNAVITKFETSHPNTIYGGCEFSLELQEVRIASSSLITRSTKTASIQKGGTQQIENNNGNAVYHTVKKGDTVYALIASPTAPYRSYGKTCQWVMDNNTNAFSRKGDFTTLKIGAKLLVGYKS